MRRYRFLLPHLVFWLLFFTVSLVYNTLGHHRGVFSLDLLQRELARPYTFVVLGRVVGTFYLSLWVFSRWFWPGRIGLVFGQVIGLGLLDATAGYVVQQRILGPLTGRWYAPPGMGAWEFITDDLTTSWLYVLVAFLFKHLRDQRRQQALLHERNAMELAYLRTQLNPHFLFNSLNNLYALALTEPARTPNVILRLSELMRYLLYDSGAPDVALEQEISYLHSYIALETLRYDGAARVEFDVSGPVQGLRIALLLFTFVENAFKHGHVTDQARPVRFQLQAHDGQLRFTAVNAVVAKEKDPVGGVGLPSVRRRLELLYPHRHQLAVRAEAPDLFRCELALDTRHLAFPS